MYVKLYNVSLQSRRHAHISSNSLQLPVSKHQYTCSTFDYDLQLNADEQQQKTQ